MHRFLSVVARGRSEMLEGEVAMSAAVGQYLTFCLKDETYGVPIGLVREIIGVAKITPVPNMPPFVNGVINLRGKIIPVVDLSKKFNMGAAEVGRSTCIIVVDVDGLAMGVMVDTVSEVKDFSADQLEPAPNLGAEVDDNAIMGIGKIDDVVVVLIDLSLALSKKHLTSLIGAGDSGSIAPSDDSTEDKAAS